MAQQILNFTFIVQSVCLQIHVYAGILGTSLFQ